MLTQNLSPQQIEAVNAIDEDVEIIACAGAGKTGVVTRRNVEGLSEEELEIYDLLVAGKRLSQADEQKVKLSAKNLFKKLSENKREYLVVDWYKDDQPRAIVKNLVESSLNDDLPICYDKESFQSKIDLLMNHFVDMAVQGYGWISTVA